LTQDDDVWWEGLTDEVPEGLTTWRGEAYDGTGGPAAHPNARFTVSASQAPQIAPEWERPEGVPISAILFGGRRASLVPLVSEAQSWEHGVFLGSIVASETTAAAEGSVGKLRRDPFAMLPFCGYNMGDYFAHWLAVGARADSSKLPRIYLVNWFRKGADGSFLWPGFGDNARVLAWIVERLEGRVEAVETPFGRTPRIEDLPIDGLGIDRSHLEELCSVDRALLRHETDSIEEHFASFGDRLPKELDHQLELLREQLG
jgi:phosphoenolpyruvate carboxykinase (GTP)